jgi:hypothetical protein
MRPVITQPIVGVMLKRCVIVEASKSLSWRTRKHGRHDDECMYVCMDYELTGTFFWIMTTTVSCPRTEMAVWPEPDIALKAYSAPTHSEF